MISIQITDIKFFMNILLVKEAFDTFLLEEAAIKTAQTFLIDGHVNKEFYTKEELESMSSSSLELSSYKELKPFCFSLIKGKNTPVYFKFVLHTSASYAEKLLAQHHLSMDETQLKSLILTIKYDGSGLLCTTGTAYKTFVMDHTVDRLWDKALKSSFQSLGISFEERL